MDTCSSTRGVWRTDLFCSHTYVKMLSEIKVFISLVYLKIGQEYPAVVEFAPFQKTAKKRSKKRDAKCGTIIEGKYSYFYMWWFKYFYIFHIKRNTLLFVPVTGSVTTIAKIYRYSFKYSVSFVCFVFTDPEYKKFLEYYNGDEEKFTSSPEILLEELEAKSKELVGRKYHAFCLNGAQKKIMVIIFKCKICYKHLYLLKFLPLKLRNLLLCWISWRINR